MAQTMGKVEDDAPRSEFMRGKYGEESRFPILRTTWRQTRKSAASSGDINFWFSGPEAKKQPPRLPMGFCNILVAWQGCLQTTRQFKPLAASVQGDFTESGRNYNKIFEALELEDLSWPTRRGKMLRGTIWW
ncbi:hypothetical protein E4U31_004045 [Claviceps sp. LM219 group G6]|nr:hypothetical protein E4U31_004045 [Claviceps sp. LM219 group G6]